MIEGMFTEEQERRWRKQDIMTLAEQLFIMLSSDVIDVDEAIERSFKNATKFIEAKEKFLKGE